MVRLTVGLGPDLTSNGVQEAQLMLTNSHNTFRGQSRTTNIVPFHMLDILSS